MTESSNLWHPMACIDPAARIASGVRVGPFAVIEADVEIGTDTVVCAHAVIRGGTRIGARCTIESHAVIGAPPQDLRFKPETPSGVIIGDGAVVRECVTVHRATVAGGFTRVGEGAFLMACAHVGHDTVVGPGAILANAVLCGGFCQIGAHAFIGGAAALHQGARVGEGAMVGGLSRISMDVPPFAMVTERNELSGLNLIGLKRRGFARAEILALKQAFRAVYGAGAAGARSGGLRGAAAAAHASGMGGAEGSPADRFLRFFESGKRGFAARVGGAVQGGEE